MLGTIDGCRLRLEGKTASHIVGDGKPFRDGSYFFNRSNHQLVQAAISFLGIDALRRFSPLLVNLLRLGRPHPLAPFRHFLTVGRFRFMSIDRIFLRLGHWRIHLAHPTRLHRLDVFPFREPTIDEHFAGSLLEAARNLIHHGRHLALIAAHGHHVHAHDHLAVTGRGQLHVVRRSEAAIGHLHHRGLRVRRRYPSLPVLTRFDLRFQLGQPLQGLLHALHTFLRLTQGGGLLRRRWWLFGSRLLRRNPLCGRRIGHFRRQFPPQPLPLGPGLLQLLLQSLAAVKRGRSGTGTYAHAILGDAVQVNQALLTQHLHGLFEQPLHEVGVVGTEIGERVVVDRHTPDQPDEGVVMAAEDSKFAGAGEAGEGGIQPHSDQQARVDGRSSRDAAAGTDAVIQCRQVQLQDVVPDSASGMIVFQEIIDNPGRKQELAIGHGQAWQVVGLGARGNRRLVVGRGGRHRRSMAPRRRASASTRRSAFRSILLGLLSWSHCPLLRVLPEPLLIHYTQGFFHSLSVLRPRTPWLVGNVAHGGSGGGGKDNGPDESYYPGTPAP